MFCDQYIFIDLIVLYVDIELQKQYMLELGFDVDLILQVDFGEEIYCGIGCLIGCKVFIIGGDFGIGVVIVIVFVCEGVDVVIFYFFEEEQDVSCIVDIFCDVGVMVVVIFGDLCDFEYCCIFVVEMVGVFGGFDIVVNNGGKQVFQELFIDIIDEQFDDMFKINVYVMFWVIKVVLLYLFFGLIIINMMLIQVYFFLDIFVDYVLMKVIINVFMKGFVQQFVLKGICVNVVVLGLIWMFLQFSDGQLQEKIVEFGKDMLFGCMGQLVEFVFVYVFFVFVELSYVVGEMLNVNGGMLIL